MPLPLEKWPALCRGESCSKGTMPRAKKTCGFIRPVEKSLFAAKTANKKLRKQCGLAIELARDLRAANPQSQRAVAYRGFARVCTRCRKKQQWEKQPETIHLRTLHDFTHLCAERRLRSLQFFQQVNTRELGYSESGAIINCIINAPRVNNMYCWNNHSICIWGSEATESNRSRNNRKLDARR
jgi:hypothetical protein